MATKYQMIITTIPTESLGSKIADVLINEKIVGCVQILPPITSTYMWQGKLCKEREFFLMAKTTSAQSQRAMARIKQLHTYDTPEIIALDISDIDSKYASWLDSVILS